MKASDVIVPIILSIVMFWAGCVSGSNKPKKYYPVRVNCFYQTGNDHTYVGIYVDSVRQDTLWRDGNFIVNKNIVNVTFK